MTTIPVLSATDLTVFKALLDRPQHWVDIEEMIDYGEVDLGEARRWLLRLLGPRDRRVEHLDSVTSR